MNEKRRQMYVDGIVSKLRSGAIADGWRIAIVVETTEKGEDIKRRVLEQIPDADTRWELAVVAIGGIEPNVH